jgi:hypothetical protein
MLAGLSSLRIAVPGDNGNIACELIERHNGYLFRMNNGVVLTPSQTQLLAVLSNPPHAC